MDDEIGKDEIDVEIEEEDEEEFYEDDDSPEAYREEEGDRDSHEPSLAVFILERFCSSTGETILTTEFTGEGEAVFIGGHIYRGQFCNGVMHGKGIYTWNDGVQYEGDFEESTITGEGTYTWADGSKYTGHVVNGIRQGYGMFYCASCPSVYKGEWLKGMRHGQGEIYFDETRTSYYKGDWVENRREGKGERKYQSGNVYIGEWRKSRRHGKGSMWWKDQKEKYVGDWLGGIQNGQGEHIWYQRRSAGSQYTVQNRYSGQCWNALRDGYGVFDYATGARYEGQWRQNVKDGCGKFTFQNGATFEGQFKNDSMGEGTLLEAIEAQERAQTPLLSLMGDVRPGSRGQLIDMQSQNVLTLQISDIVDDDIACEEELKQLHYAILQSIGQLRKIYSFYSSLGHAADDNNTFVLNRFQLWRMLKDSCVLQDRATLSELDRVIAVCTSDCSESEIVHFPDTPFLVRQFLQILVHVAYHMFGDECKQKPGFILSHCLSRLLEEDMLPNAGNVKGNFFVSDKAKVLHALKYKPTCWELYQMQSRQRKVSPYDSIMPMRHFLFALDDAGLINTNLTVQLAVSVIARDNPLADDGIDINMDAEIVFLEFFEALIECASIAIKPAQPAVCEPPPPPVVEPVVIEEQPMEAEPIEEVAVVKKRQKSDSESKTSLRRGSNKELHKGSRTSLKKGGGGSESDVIKSTTSSKHDLRKGPASKSNSSISSSSSAGGIVQTVSNVSVAQQPIAEEEEGEEKAEDRGSAMSLERDEMMSRVSSHPCFATPLEQIEDIPEDPFEFWCWQLDRFFNKRLFPAFGLPEVNLS